ncbi:unnamed protein product, partial [Meganyctiphanes norvegica]
MSRAANGERRAAFMLTTVKREQHNPNECPICNRHYNVANDQMRVRSLGCGHSMCTSCIRRMHQRNSVKCPQCRYVHQAESVERIPINFGMESLIQSLKQTSLTSRIYDEAYPILNAGLCQTHETVKLFFCVNCKMFICTHCTAIDHPRGDSHKIINIQEAFSMKKSRFLSDIECQLIHLTSVHNKFSGRIMKLQNAKQGLENVVSQIQETLAGIEKLCTMQTLLKKGFQNMETQLETVKQQAMNASTLDKLSAVEQNSSTMVKEAKNRIKVNENPLELLCSQVFVFQIQTSFCSALNIFDAATTEEGKEAMQICKEYNINGCKNSNCKALHICTKHVERKLGCISFVCILNHDIMEPSCKELVSSAGISTNQSPGDILIAVSLKCGIFSRTAYI